MHSYFILLVICGLISCSISRVSRTDTQIKPSSPKEINSKTLEPETQCEGIIKSSKNSFLNTKTSGITWEEEYNILPCWISSINAGNTDLENILYQRLLERCNLIQEGNTRYLSTLRITENIFSSIPSSKMLDAAYNFTLLDTCINYSGEGAFHIGWIGINHLLKMTNNEYQNKFTNSFLIYTSKNNSLDKYDENSCEYLEIAYKEMFATIKNDYAHNAIPLKTKQVK